ncbi:MAG: 4Fe-4S binding protein [Candidatus Hydrogenedentes bacterium]|nr:4Fe-4S binding protein [Candidatus Hydrogenedentota bacterium]
MNLPLENVDDLERFRDEIKSRIPEGMTFLTVCGGTGCHAYGCVHVADAVAAEIDKRGLGDRLRLQITGCQGFCERGPIVVARPQGLFYQRVKVDDVPAIIDSLIDGGEPVKHLLYKGADNKRIPLMADIPFYARQQREVFGLNGTLSPTSIEDYIAVGGFRALSKTLFDISPEDVIEEIKASGLRGRGGGGFPTGRKWETCRNAPGESRYVICNADEGDPGAYMDRSLLEGNPFLVLEGMLIGAYAIGAHEGYVYVRTEYPLAVKHIRNAIDRAREYGLLGENILGSGFSFDVKVNRGGGAFVCGESTALMASLEGKPGEPRAKYVHTVESGLWNKPSNLNNVETWANVPLIINRGAKWYAGIGTEKSKGTKIFSLVGKINNTGLVEVPMGMPLREIIFDIGGGIPKKKKFKAVQTGGPSGGCIPADHLDLPVDFDELSKVGSMMGSGGLIVMDQDNCMVDVARYFTRFLTEESCGKCAPCREGTTQMLQLLDNICAGRGRIEDLDIMRDLCDVMEEASLCALGRTAGNPVRTTLRYFEDEYRAHIIDKRCPAGVCAGLFHYEIDAQTCTGCGACAKKCPQSCISGGRKDPHVIDQDKCVVCGVCYSVCPFGAVTVV